MIFQNELIKSFKTYHNQVAIDNGDTLVTYANVLKIANKITTILLNKKMPSEAFVGIQLTDKTNLIYSIIGVLNARGVIVPLDVTMPDSRMENIIKDLNLSYMITSKDSPLVEKHSSVEYIFIEDILDSENESDEQSVQYPKYDSQDSAYVYFTSGTTGKPKGIIGKNCSLLQFLKWEIDTFSIASGTRVSQFISPYFDAFLRDVFAPLLAGGTICIPPADEDFFTPEKMVAWIDKAKINLIHCVPSLFRVFNNAQITADNFTTLTHVLMSGEKIIPSELANWYTVFKSRIQLVNLYGTTETTMIRTSYNIKPEDVELPKMPIGSPINDTQLLVADENLKPCNLFVPGDLYIITPYTTKGYLNNDQLNTEKFLKVNSPTLGKAFAFKTGDKARMMPGGVIDLMGREDRQVKLRGIRVELDEIENVLTQSEYVKNAIVIKHSDDETPETTTDASHGTESLIAFVIKDDSASQVDFKDTVLAYLNENLPSYMIPSDVVEVTDFPLLENGKVNYNGLLDYLTTNEIVLPENKTESELLAIWKEILGDKEISTDDSFHTIGGNSLAIMRLIGKIYKEYNVRISLNEMFSNLTIQKQAKYINQANKDNILTITKTEEKEAYNLTAAQERIYYNYELDKSSTAFNLPMSWMVNGDFDKQKLHNAFLALIDRHESLRTGFKFVDGKLQQVVKTSISFNIEEINATQETAKQKIIDFIRPFDLAEEPLIRCGLLTIDKNKTIMVVDIHHIVCDGISQNNVFGDLLQLYKGEELIPLPLQYKDYAEWESEFKMTDDYISHREFWLKTFEGKLPKLTFPTTITDTKQDTNRGGNTSFKIEKNVLSKITDNLNNKEITTFSALYSLFHLYLYQFTAEEDIVIGINTSGRLQDELEDVVGMFTKTLPVRYRLKPHMKFHDYVKEIHQLLIEANSAQIYDLSNIVKDINNSRKTTIDSLFEVMLVFQNFEEKKVDLDEVNFSSYEFENTTYKYPITLFASEGDDAMFFRMEYSAAHFTAGDIDIIINQFKELVTKVAEDIDAEVIQYIDSEFAVTSIQEEEIAFDF
ncbi:non-ribosomal peptide synthetase [Aquimarina mytili]|uniref:Amino acid adenylation domain-containing protein n=1 Tax=Aquimarina mytili TaxID=874423 RepID=A0A937A807_9FLAO|nr:non-ribosomal peptide synthetase [Aquimarina mytili]MBL0685924.1 amino acid adenylation domain-containing protein [Aquimarina mytili]